VSSTSEFTIEKVHFESKPKGFSLFKSDKPKPYNTDDFRVKNEVVQKLEILPQTPV
jgi:hypothetical protein